VTGSIQGREPAPSSELRANGEPIYAFVELVNASESEQSIVITFERERRSVGHISLLIPAGTDRWRTWGRTQRIAEAGAWAAVVRTEGGRELGRASFSVGS
jgi:hypothetical protein